MYQNIYIEKKSNFSEIVHLWDDKKGYKKFPYQRYAYIKDPNGSYVALDGTKVKKITSWNKETKGLYESDVKTDLRTLVDLYYDEDNLSENHTTMFFDIEVSIKDGFPNIIEADKPIISIAYHLKERNLSVVLILDENNVIKKIDEKNLKVLPFRNEKDLLIAFIRHMEYFRPTILSGWNSDDFDIPYMYKRMLNVLGQKIASKISPIGIVEKINELTYKIAGISSIDYMRIFKSFTQGERPSYSLDFISKLELGRGKVEYSGSLEDLFRDDIKKFIQYNLEDVILIRDLDKKLNFIALVQAICHKGHVPYDNIHSVSSYLDGAALTYLKRVGVVAPNRKKIFKFELSYPADVGDKKIFFNKNVENIPEIGSLRVNKTKTSTFSIKYTKYSENYIVLDEPLKERILPEYEIHLELPGAYVQSPKPGLYYWVYDLDLTSLYPSEIMSLNISPETKIGRILDWTSEDWVRRVDRDYHLKIKSKRIKYSFKELEEFLTSNNYSVAANGVFYRQDSKGFIPTILSKWFEERADFKRLRDEYGHKGEDEKYKYYDLRQRVQKVLLNSFYGVLALASFRFYDVDNAEAITSSGQQIIKFTKSVADRYYQTILKNDKEYVIYIDTDSIFVSALPLIRHYYPDINENDEKAMTEKSLGIAKNVQEYINKMYDIYAKRYHNIKGSHRFNIKQEVVSKSAFWVAKKRYAQLMLSKEGVRVNEMDVKGIDTVRSDFPKAFKNFFENVLLDILNRKSVDDVNARVAKFKENIENESLEDIMFPTGVKDITKWNPQDRGKFHFIKGTPVHVKSSLAYNDLCDYKNLNIGKIIDGEKIKWAYLKENEFNIDTFALREKSPDEFKEFVEKYIDRNKMFDSKIKNKLEDFYNALNWTLVVNEKINQFFAL